MKFSKVLMYTNGFMKFVLPFTGDVTPELRERFIDLIDGTDTSFDRKDAGRYHLEADVKRNTSVYLDVEVTQDSQWTTFVWREFFNNGLMLNKNLHLFCE